MNDNIEKILSETFKNPDVMSFLVKQVKEQLEKEQKDETAKQEKLNNKTKIDTIFEEHEKKMSNLLKNTKLNKNVGPIVHDMDKKVKSYLNNNDFLKDYINNRDQFMSIFDQAVKNNPCEKCSYHCDADCDYDSSTDYCSYCECKDDCEGDSITKSYTSYTTGISQSVDEKGNPVGYIYFNLDSNEQLDVEKQLLDYYTLIKLHADKWTNWEIDHYDNTLYNLPISKLVDTYTYNFTADESKKIDNNEDMVYSYTHVEIDNELPMVSIYIMDYSKKTNKVYDFNRIIFTPSDNASENDRQLFYFDLYKYLNNPLTIETVLEDFCYTFINKHIIHGVSDFPTTDKEYYNLMHSLINSLLEEKKKDGIKLTIKKEDTPDKTNSILDKLGIPHNNGVVDIPISDDKFILNRNSVMDKAFDCDKEEFTDEDCLSDYVEDICKKCEFNEECKEEYKKEEQEYDAYLEKLLNRHEIWDDDVWWEKIFDFFKGDSEDTFIKANDDFIIYMSFKNKIGKNIKDSELYSTSKIDKNNLTITIIEADPSEGFDVSWVGKLSMMINPIVDSDDKYEKMLSYKNMYPLISDLTVKMCENVEIDPHKDIYYFKNNNNFTHNNLYKAVTDIILECINYFYNNITDKDK